MGDKLISEYFAELETDIRLREHFFTDPGYRGVVVEVGGGTPIHYSMSRHWVLNGWRAIIVEPNPHFVALHQAIGNEVYACACSDSCQPAATFYVVGPACDSTPDHQLTEHAYSSLGLSQDFLRHAGKNSVDEMAHTKIVVPVRTLDAIMEEAGVPQIDILSVDTEGWELQVMRGFDLQRHRPAVVVLENLFYDPGYAEYMSANGYKLVTHTGHNFIFIPTIRASHKMQRIACTHPGKIGDALYALPAIRWLCEKHGCQADFYTSEYCRPMESLMRQQSCIADFIVPAGYSPDNYSCGVQPFQMPVPSGYEMVYHLGFRTTPDRALPDFIAGWTGAPHGLPIFYEFEKRDVSLTAPYVVVAPRGDTVFKGFIETCPFPVVQIGAKGDAVSTAGIDRTGADFVETCNILAGARAFLGVMSSQLALANGFPIPRVAYDFGRNDMRHVVHSLRNHYPSSPTTAQLIDHIAYLESYSETFRGPGEYYRLTREAPFIDELTHKLNGAYNPFHTHRRWEYGLTLQVAQRYGLKTCLDVGGGGSILSAVMMSQGICTVTVDPCDYVAQHQRQGELLGIPLDYRKQDFMTFPEAHTADLVACISVLEHIEHDQAFFQKLLRHVAPGGILVLTVDFHPTGEIQWHGMQCRTYNAASLKTLADSADGFEVLGPMDYEDRGQHVYGYNFASLTLRRLA